MQVDNTKGREEGRHQAGNFKKWPRWAEALRDVAFSPEKYKDKVLKVTNEAVVYPDLYPKGKKHVLVISRMNGLNSLEDAGKEHLQHLQNIHNLGQEWVAKFLNEDQSMIFRLGYHSVPSLRQLHMHVISQDFDSPFLKNAKHWKSFASSFFLDSKNVLAELESNGKINPCSEEGRMLESPLRCHRCKTLHKDIAHLKYHICKCKIPFAPDLIPYLYASNLSA
ncbi:transcription factor bHLH140 [Cryptomeria japonica]|uniref:transcription factor bHLH140 n=1 Tax=Cryptomeria japonica TaxID=3369 RepID=UPI0027D9FD78|nr:transcription factor bHLH140 [Cryptomeria japonica]XP_057862428.2 transcription factor bHLH140 [Cryptomeria japonica]